MGDFGISILIGAFLISLVMLATLVFRVKRLFDEASLELTKISIEYEFKLEYVKYFNEYPAVIRLRNIKCKSNIFNNNVLDELTRHCLEIQNQYTEVSFKQYLDELDVTFYLNLETKRKFECYT